MRDRFQQNGDKEAVEQAKAVLDEIQHLSAVDRERLFGYLEGTGKMILVEPGYLLTESKMPGLDGQKMSKSYHNTITCASRKSRWPRRSRACRPTPTACAAPIRAIRRVPGLATASGLFRRQHQGMGQPGCKTAGIGCIECKQPVIDGILKEQVPMRERAQMYLDDPTLVKNIIADGCEKARERPRDHARCARSHGAGIPLMFGMDWESLIWIAIGFGGQGLFMMRFVVQWWSSEKAKQVVVPVAFGTSASPVAWS
jgi:tryptophanyl-tRNA synthetase